MRRQGRLVEGLRRPAAGRARSSAPWPTAPRSRSRPRASRRRARPSRATSAGLFPSLSLSSHVQRFRISANRPLANYSSPNFTTVQNDFPLGLSVSYEVDLAGPRLAQRRGRAGVGAAVGGRPREHAAGRQRRAGGRLVQPGDAGRLAGRAGSLDRAAAPGARLRRPAPRPRRRHRPRGRAAAGPARQHADAGRRAEAPARAVRARDRRAGRRARADVQPAAGQARPAAAADSPWACRPTCCSAGPTSPRPSARWPRPTRRSASPPRRSTRASSCNRASARKAASLSTLFDAPSLVWSIGVSATQTLFDAGRTRANVDFAKAGYDASVATYRAHGAGARCRRSRTASPASPRSIARPRRPRWPSRRRSACWTWPTRATKAAWRPTST